MIFTLLTVGVLLIVPTALGDTSGDPIAAIWDAIYDLKNRDNILQAQIDELRADNSASNATGLASELSTDVVIESSHESGGTVIKIAVINDGPDRAAGVRLTAFYKMPLLQIDSIAGGECSNLGRGIVECYLGTIEPGDQSVVTMDATVLESDQETSLTVDVSSTTEDRIPSNNHSVVDFVTAGDGMAEDVENEEHTDDAAETNSTNVQESDQTQDDQNKDENQSQDTASGNQTSSESTSDDSSSSENADDSSNEEAADDENSDQTSSESSSSDSSSQGEEGDDSESGEAAGSNQTSTTGQGG